LVKGEGRRGKGLLTNAKIYNVCAKRDQSPLSIVEVNKKARRKGWFREKVNEWLG